MSSTASARLTAGDLVQAVDEIVGAFLDSTVSAAGDTGEQPSGLTGCVQVTGAFTGAVVLSVSREFGVLAAARMLGTDVASVDHDAVADTVGELTNMVGGSVKALLPEPSVLSLPVVGMGEKAAFSLPGAEMLARAQLRCENEVLSVCVFGS